LNRLAVTAGLWDISRMAGPRAMSALGHKRTNRPGPKFDFVRYCPKADNRGCRSIVRFVPQADIALGPLENRKAANCSGLR
jgi:hypothetical protein